jgi:hypothetical protein
MTGARGPVTTTSVASPVGRRFSAQRQRNSLNRIWWSAARFTCHTVVEVSADSALRLALTF